MSDFEEPKTDAASARRLALAGRLRGLARVAQALTLVIGLLVAGRTIARGGSLQAADKTELALGTLGVAVGAIGLLKGRRGGETTAH